MAWGAGVGVALGFWVGAIVGVADGALVAVDVSGAVVVGAVVSVCVAGIVAVAGDVVGGDAVGGAVGGRVVGWTAGCGCVAVGASVLVAAGLPPQAAIHSSIASIIVKRMVFREGRDFIVAPPFESMTITPVIISRFWRNAVSSYQHA
jgi:hypothetical protein